MKNNKRWTNKGSWTSDASMSDVEAKITSTVHTKIRPNREDKEHLKVAFDNLEKGKIKQFWRELFKTSLLTHGWRERLLEYIETEIKLRGINNIFSRQIVEKAAGRKLCGEDNV